MIQVSVMPSTTDEDGGAMHSKAKAARISSGGNQGRSSQSSVSPLASQSSEHTLESFKAEIESASISAICHAALVKSPAAARAAYSKHNNSIEPELAKTFEIVGSYEDEGNRSPFIESMHRGDEATIQYLLLAGAGKVYLDRKDPLASSDLADQNSLALAALEHCAALSSPNELISITALPLEPYQLDPAFFWVPRNKRKALVVWARNAFVVQLATTIEPFSDLPDDCAGDVLEFLQMEMLREKSLHIATQCSSPEAHAWVRAALAAYIVADATETLEEAATFGMFEIAQNCLKKGANVNAAVEVDGSPALCRAAFEGYNEIVQLLLDAGADVEAKTNPLEYKPLMNAARRGKISTVKLLLKAGADINAKNREGHTALERASRTGYKKMVELLLEAGADVYVQAHDGTTPLMGAAARGHQEVCVMLLRGGADAEMKCKKGKTVMDYVCEDVEDD